MRSSGERLRTSARSNVRGISSLAGATTASKNKRKKKKEPREENNHKKTHTFPLGTSWS